MRRTTTPSSRHSRGTAETSSAPAGTTGADRGAGPGVPWSARRVLAESDIVARRLVQLQARPWWRVSARELDELDARVSAVRAHAGRRR